MSAIMFTFVSCGDGRQDSTEVAEEQNEEVVENEKDDDAEFAVEAADAGYDTLLEENASNLSGGQKQRLSIARSLLGKPRILVLDEAASALDPESEAIFIRNLSKIAVGRTVVMISHRLSTLVNADAILVMQRGRLVDALRGPLPVQRVQLAVDRVEAAPMLRGLISRINDRPATEVGGWGLHLVQTLSNRWGVYEGSTHVWFEIDRSSPTAGAA